MIGSSTRTTLRLPNPRSPRNVTPAVVQTRRLFADEEAHMKRIRAWLALPALLLAGGLVVVAAQPRATLERHEFVIRDFHTEGGAMLPEARIVYTTLGTLNANGDNAVLLPSHYMANFNGYNWLIRGADPDRALDPARDFLVLTELFGNGRSSSPSNTPEPFHGPRFPATTIRDNVDAVHRLLVEAKCRKRVDAVWYGGASACEPTRVVPWTSFPGRDDRPLCTLVPKISSELSRSGRDDGRAWYHSRSFHHRPLGSPLRTDSERAYPARDAESEPVVARGRNLYSRCRPVDLFISGHRLSREHDRFHAVSETGSHRGQSLSAVC